MVGQDVVVFFGLQPASMGKSITQLEGVVTAEDARGLWLDATKRWFADNSSTSYSGACFIPWAAIAFVKPKK